MNFLAHIYLSGTNDFVKIGNFMADGIHGNKFDMFHPDIQKGIKLHREIDTFTDFHPIFRKSKHRLHEKYGHYSGVIMDIFYDHFLAKNFSDYCTIPLEIFAQDFYQLLNENYDLLTEKIKMVLPYLIKDNWLVEYASIDGIAHILYNMDRRTKFKSKMQFSVDELNLFYDDFEKEFKMFFAQIKDYVDSKLRIRDEN